MLARKGVLSIGDENREQAGESFLAHHRAGVNDHQCPKHIHSKESLAGMCTQAISSKTSEIVVPCTTPKAAHIIQPSTQKPVSMLVRTYMLQTGSRWCSLRPSKWALLVADSHISRCGGKCAEFLASHGGQQPYMALSSMNWAMMQVHLMEFFNSWKGWV